jgi:hypothetical protein
MSDPDTLVEGIVGALSGEYEHHFAGREQISARELAQFLVEQASVTTSLSSGAIGSVMARVEGAAAELDFMHPGHLSTLMGLIVGARVVRAQADNERLTAEAPPPAAPAPRRRRLRRHRG